MTDPETTRGLGGGVVSSGSGLDAVRLELLLTREELWVLYIGLGGMVGIDELTAYLSGTGRVTRMEHNTMVQALNERFIDVGGDHPVAYIESDG